MNDPFTTCTCEICRGDIFFIDLGYGIGSEQAYARPCLCVQNDVGNLYSRTIIIVPITSAAKKRMPTHVSLPADCGLKCRSIALCEQLRVVDKRRIDRYIGSAPAETMERINRALAVSIGLPLSVA